MLESLDTFAARDAKALQQTFVKKFAPIVAAHCKGRLTPEQMKACVVQAGMHSGWGRFVIGHNYWMLPGRGDAGSFLVVRLQNDPTLVSSVRPIVLKYAKFSGIPQAIEAWCKQVKR